MGKRVNKIEAAIFLDESYHRKLRLLAAEQRSSVPRILEGVVVNWLDNGTTPTTIKLAKIPESVQKTMNPPKPKLEPGGSPIASTSDWAPPALPGQARIEEIMNDLNEIHDQLKDTTINPDEFEEEAIALLTELRDLGASKPLKYHLLSSLIKRIFPK